MFEGYVLVGIKGDEVVGVVTYGEVGAVLVQVDVEDVSFVYGNTLAVTCFVCLLEVLGSGKSGYLRGCLFCDWWFLFCGSTGNCV